MLCAGRIYVYPRGRCAVGAWQSGHAGARAGRSACDGDDMGVGGGGGGLGAWRDATSSEAEVAREAGAAASGVKRKRQRHEAIAGAGPRPSSPGHDASGAHLRAAGGCSASGAAAAAVEKPRPGVLDSLTRDELKCMLILVGEMGEREPPLTEFQEECVLKLSTALMKQKHRLRKMKEKAKLHVADID